MIAHTALMFVPHLTDTLYIEPALPAKPLGLEQLAKFPIVTFSRNTQPYIVLREMFTRAGLAVTIHASASLATVVRMALDGIGIAVIPPAILDNVAAPGKLRAVKTSARMPSLNFVVSWASSPDSFAAQKVAGIAVEIAKESAGGKRVSKIAEH